VTVSRTDVAIVGGGVHGVHLAVRLLEAGVVSHDRLRIVEPDGLLAAFHEKCRQCGMVEFRSPFVHHVGVDPFSLREFADERGRLDELVACQVGAKRPTVPLFFDHARDVVDRYDLESVVLEARVLGVTERADGVDLETTDDDLSARACVLAIGHGRSYTRPEWALDIQPGAPVAHVWDERFDPEDVGDRVGIVGGGITAAQLTASLARPSREVTVVARSPFRVATLEAGREWMHVSRTLEGLQSLPPTSRKRQQVVTEVRRDGTMPPEVFSRLRRAIDRGWATLERNEISTVTPGGGTVVVTCQDGAATWFDDLVLATGFDSPYNAPLLERIREETDLQTGYRGGPALEDGTVRWLRADGTPSRVAVSGIVAQGTLGPFARNILGARRAGDLLVDELEALVSGSEPACQP